MRRHHLSLAAGEFRPTESEKVQQINCAEGHKRRFSQAMLLDDLLFNKRWRPMLRYEVTRFFYQQDPKRLTREKYSS